MVMLMIYQSQIKVLCVCGCVSGHDLLCLCGQILVYISILRIIFLCPYNFKEFMSCQTWIEG